MLNLDGDSRWLTNKITSEEFKILIKDNRIKNEDMENEVMAEIDLSEKY